MRAITFLDVEDLARCGGFGGSVKIYLDNLKLEEAPEPSVLAFMGFGIAGMCLLRRFRK